MHSVCLMQSEDRIVGFKTLARDYGGRAASVTRPRLDRYPQLRKNDHLSFHAQAVVQSADVRIKSGLAERDSEASYSRRRLCQPVSVLRGCLKKAGVHTVRWRIENTVTCTVGIDGYVGGRRNEILRFSPEGDSVRRGRIFVGPFHCVARANRDNGNAEAHHREGVRAGACRNNLAATNGHAILRMLVLW